MATSFKKTAILSFPKAVNQETSDTLYWKHLEFPITRKNFGAVTHIDVSPVEPYRYAVTSSTKVEVFSCETHELYKTMTKFKKTAFNGNFRSDGRLLVAGGEEGLVKIFDVDTKHLLRQFKGHTRPVHVTRFTADKLRVMSGGDDNLLRLFDIPSEAELQSYSEHEDYIRAGAASSTNSDIIMTGSYDHTARLWDTRTNESVVNVNHGFPVEAVLLHPNGSLFYTAGGETIKVWDALAGGRLLHTIKSHHKTVTSLCYCSDYKRLVSAGLDRHVKIYDTSTYEVVHSLDYMSSLLCVAIPPDDSWISVGMTDGHFVTQRRRNAEDVYREIAERKLAKKANFRYRMAQTTFQKQEDDAVIEHKRKKILEPYDNYLKKFEYSKALSAVLEVTKRRRFPEVTFSVLEELYRRDGLRRAMTGRTEQEQDALVTFFTKNMSNMKFTEICIEAAIIFLDIYHTEAQKSTSKLAMKIKQLKSVIDTELELIKELFEVRGILDALFATSQSNSGWSEADFTPQPGSTIPSKQNDQDIPDLATTETQSESNSNSDMEADS